MTRTSLSLAVLLACGIGATSLASQAQKQSPSQSPVVVIGQALGEKPESRAEGREAIDGAAAAAVIGAISRQFGENAVQVKLAKVDVLPANLQERVLRGNGSLQIGGQSEWLDFTFDALYDTEQASVYYPRLAIGNGGESMDADSALARALSRRVQNAMGEEFAQQAVSLSLDDITARNAGKRFIQVRATGVAQFEGEGGAEALVTAVYDRKLDKWLQVDYELGSSASQAPGETFASL
ncbi:MAG: hypothetical protein ABIO38_04250 [Luteimonas sp.]